MFISKQVGDPTLRLAETARRAGMLGVDTLIRLAMKRISIGAGLSMMAIDEMQGFAQGLLYDEGFGVLQSQGRVP